MAVPLVLVHGTRTSHSQWNQQLPLLQAAGRGWVTPDLPGHGTRRDEPFTLAGALRTIADALARAAAMGEGRAHLVGSSLGAMLSIRAAAEHPDLLASLVVCGGSVQPTATTARLYGRAMVLVDHLPGATPTRTRRMFDHLLGAEGAAAYLGGGRAGVQVVEPAMRAVAGLDLRADLARIPAPVTLLNGRFDQLRLQSRSFARAAPRGRVVTLPYGTHLVNLTQPSRFTADLLRVIEDAERSVAVTC